MSGDKINILYEEGDSEQEGCLNIFYRELEDIYAGSTQEILCDKVFEKTPHDILPSLLSKIRHSGLIKLVGTELQEIARGLYTRSLSLQDANKLLYDGKVRCFSIEQVVELLQNSGFKISKKRLNNCEYFVEAVRD